MERSQILNIPARPAILSSRIELDLYAIDAIDAINEQNEDENKDDLINRQDWHDLFVEMVCLPSTSIASSLR